MEEGFDQFDGLGWIKEIPDAERRNQQVAHETTQIRWKKRGHDCNLADSRVEGDRITAAIRAEPARPANCWERRDHLYSRLASRNMTEAERADPAMYEPGAVIVLTQNAPGHRKGERIVVGDGMPADLAKLAARFQVYRADQIPLATGDVVRITANGQSKDGHRLNNGAVYHVAGFTEQGDVRLDNGWVVGAQFGFLTLGHVATSHGSQGRTCEDHVILAQSAQSLPATNREQFYVSVSRSRRKLTVYSDDKAALRDAIENFDSRVAATELVERKQERVSLFTRLAKRARLLMGRERGRRPAKEVELNYGR